MKYSHRYYLGAVLLLGAGLLIWFGGCNRGNSDEKNSLVKTGMKAAETFKKLGMPADMQFLVHPNIQRKFGSDTVMLVKWLDGKNMLEVVFVKGEVAAKRVVPGADTGLKKPVKLKEGVKVVTAKNHARIKIGMNALAVMQRLGIPKEIEFRTHEKYRTFFPSNTIVLMTWREAKKFIRVNICRGEVAGISAWK